MATPDFEGDLAAAGDTGRGRLLERDLRRPAARNAEWAAVRPNLRPRPAGWPAIGVRGGQRD
jgi:hypothetical protein